MMMTILAISVAVFIVLVIIVAVCLTLLVVIDVIDEMDLIGKASEWIIRRLIKEDGDSE